jgi:hypothetical protein
MSDSPLPFRPRIPSPADRALSNIEAQTAAGRRRLNRFELSRAFFWAGGAALAACSLLVVLAFVLSRGGYALFAWLILASLTVVLLSALRRVRRVWLSRADAAVAIDRRAGLEDRLATLVTPSARRSRLWNFLLHENLRLLPSWEPRRLQPRPVPRNAWFFAVSLLLAFVTLWMTPRRGALGRAALTMIGENPPERRSSDAEQSPEAEEEPPQVGPSSSFWSELPERLRQAIVGSRSPSAIFPGAIPEKTLPVEEERGGPAIAGDRMAGHGPVRSAPASSEAARVARRGGTAPNGTSQPSPSGRHAEEVAPATSARPARGEAPKELARVETGRSKNETHTPQTREGGVGSGGAGAGSGGNKEGLYGERQAPGKATGSFALDLDAMRSAQRATEGVDESTAVPPPSRLADDQRLDDAIRRAQVPVEYEKIVQKIFNRGPEPPDRPD